MFTGLKHQKEKRRMDHFAGLDGSVTETSVCIADDTGRIVRCRSALPNPLTQRAKTGQYRCLIYLNDF